MFLDLPLSLTLFRTGTLDSPLSNDWSSGDTETWKSSSMFGLLKVNYIRVGDGDGMEEDLVDIEH